MYIYKRNFICNQRTLTSKISTHFLNITLHNTKIILFLYTEHKKTPCKNIHVELISGRKARQWKVNSISLLDK